MTAEKIYPILFTVQGGGDFPIDMLRYDHCWPASQDDVAATLSRYAEGAPKQVRNVTLRGFSYTKPPKNLTVWTARFAPKNGVTIERWKSFGWNVIEVHESF